MVLRLEVVAGDSEVCSHSQLCNKLQAILNYMSPSLSQKKIKINLNFASREYNSVSGGSLAYHVISFIPSVTKMNFELIVDLRKYAIHFLLCFITFWVFFFLYANYSFL